MDNTTKNIEKKEVFSGKWLRFLLTDFQNKEIIVKNYEYVERTTRKGEFDGVTIVGILRYPLSKDNDKIILIGNYRPTVGKFVVEFPAGLVDENGDGYIDAIRELKEETGFIPEKVLDILNFPDISPVSQILYSEPSLTNENEKIVMLQINGDEDRNKNAQQELELTENINVHLIDFDHKLLENIIKLAKENNYEIETKVYTFALGLSLSSKLMAG